MAFKIEDGWADLPVTVPCGQCVGCRLEHSRQWAVRCVHEASMYEKNCFVTLTYSDENLPDDHSLHIEDHQKFMKRLRKKYGRGIRFFHCGEYGDTLGRPHYHYCLFNHDFEDKILWKVKDDIPLYLSESLQTIWPAGFSTIGDVTFASAAYCARYIMKKITGTPADYHYLDPGTGVILKQEYIAMSRRPGLGKGWFDKWTTDVFPCDNVVLNGKTFRPPRFYDKQYEIIDEKSYTNLKGSRLRQAKKHVDNNTPLRLKIRERIQNLKLKQLQRNHDND